MTVEKGALTKDKYAEMQTYSSNAIDELSLTNDLGDIFTELAHEFQSNTGQVLIFIDATNGNLSITGFDSARSETFDDYFVIVQLKEFWEDNQNAYDFDEIIKSCIKRTLNSSRGKQLLQKFRVFFQTESDKEEEIKQNAS